MRKQTAVQWLQQISQLRELDKFDFQKAKAMEREQIIDAYWNGTTDIEKGKAVKEGIEFYNETYGGEQ